MTPTINPSYNENRIKQDKIPTYNGRYGEEEDTEQKHDSYT